MLVSPTNLLFILISAALLLLAAAWLFRRPQPAPITPHGPGNLLVPILRLIGFGLLAFLLIGFSLLFFIDYREVSNEIARTPSSVEKPPDLPFEVEDVTFAAPDGARLAGWLVPPRDAALVILLHGAGGNRLDTLEYARPLVKAGFGVLMLDERGSGESGGPRRSFGWEDPPDIGAAIDYLRSRPEVGQARLGIAGCSLGAQIALQSAARYPALAGVWADGAAVVVAQDNPPPDRPAMALIVASNWIIDRLLVFRLGISPPPGMLQTIGKIAPRPILLVAGGAPLPYFGSEAPLIEHFARSAGENASVWVIPDAGHCGGPAARPQEYGQRLVEFFNQALLP